MLNSHAFEKSQKEPIAPVCEWHRWGEAVRGCSLLGAFPEKSPLEDQCCSPQAMECCSSCGLLILFPLLLAAQTSVPASKRDCQLQREGKNKHCVCSGSALSVFFALLKHAQPLKECSPKARGFLAAGISFRFIYSKPPWKWQHSGRSSRAFSAVLSTWFIVALWQSNAERIENKGEALPGLFKLAMMF